MHNVSVTRRKRIRAIQKNYRISEALVSGRSYREIAAEFGVKECTVRQWRSRVARRSSMHDDLDSLFDLGPRRKKPPMTTIAAQVLERRIEGKSYDTIARELDISSGAARQLVTSQLLGMDGDEAKNADTIRGVELLRLDRLLEKAWSAVEPEDGTVDLKAMETVLKIMDRRSRYLGLDSPLKIDIEPQLRKMAEEQGLDPDEVVADAEVFLTELAKQK